MGGSNGQLQKSASLKSLTFDVDEAEVLPTHSKYIYNRKPDSNVTFKKLTPKLKNEIREELNQYKKNEMSVHASSEIYTAFHY
jgi:phosphatase and actin regulator 4